MNHTASKIERISEYFIPPSPPPSLFLSFLPFYSTETAAVRLQGGNSTYMGGVEIQRHEIWHSVCSIAWDKHDADVVCRQLGFPEAVVELAHGQFGSKPGPMWLTSVHCHGNETSLDQCVSAGWEIKKDCGERYGAGVICKTENVTGGI